MTSAMQEQSETIAVLREARDLNRARARRLIAQLRKLRANLAQQPAADAQASDDHYMSQLLDRDATQAGATVKAAISERAQMAAMRELSRWNAKHQLSTHFRRNFLQVTVSKGAIAPLALLAGAGLLSLSRSVRPSDIYPAMLCFAVAALWGWRYFAAVFAPLRHRFFLRRVGRPTGDELKPAPASAIGPPESSDSGSFSSPTEKCTVADLLAEMRPTTSSAGPQTRRLEP